MIRKYLFAQVKKFRENRFLKFIVLPGFFAALLFFGAVLIVTIPDFRLNKDYSSVLYGDDKSLVRIYLSPTGKYRIPVEINDVSDIFVKSIIIKEDHWFYYHPGFNPYSIFRALQKNISSGTIVSGGSTISMQLARLLFPPEKRNYVKKVLEILRAVKLELLYSKEDILRNYLNILPMGGNIEGVAAAAYFYFGKRAHELGFAESCLLLSLLESPNNNNPFRNREKSLQRRNSLIRTIGSKMKLTSRDIEKKCSIKMPENKFSNPFDAPHFALRVKKMINQNHVYSGINKLMQKKVSIMLADHLKNLNAYNGSVIIIDNKTMNIKVYAGSPDYESAAHCNRINSLNTRRPPGSTLKPVIYAKAVQHLGYTPRRMVYDMPINYDEYKPRNYSRMYQVLVPFEEALYRSLNLPAVRLEKKLDDEYGLASFLRDTRIATIQRNASFNDLALVLGSFELTLEEMAGIYAMLANQGLYRNLNFFSDQDTVSGRHLISKEAAYIVSEMLAKSRRSDMPYSWEFVKNKRKLAVKTGTSYGATDGWCFGYDSQYTVGVWIGSLDNSYVGEFVGGKVAAPLLFKIFSYIHPGKAAWFKRPEAVKIRKVCQRSGLIPGHFCTSMVDDLFIPGISSVRSCDIHKRVIIDLKTGYSVCSYCMKKYRSYAYKITEQWPLKVDYYLRKTGKIKAAVPEHNHLCQHSMAENRLRILSPLPDSVFIIHKAFAIEKQKIPLIACASGDSQKINWYLGRKLLGVSSTDNIVFFDPKPGTYEITAVDRRGRSARTRFEVKKNEKPGKNKDIK